MDNVLRLTLKWITRLVLWPVAILLVFGYMTHRTNLLRDAEREHEIATIPARSAAQDVVTPTRPRTYDTTREPFDQARADASRPPHTQDAQTLYAGKARVDLEDGITLFVEADRMLRYRAQDGAVEESPVPVGAGGQAVLATRHGLFVVGGHRPRSRQDTVEVAIDDIALMRDDGSIVRGKLGVPRMSPLLAEVAGGAVLVAGGARKVEYSSRGRTIERAPEAELIELRGDELLVHRLPDLPGPPRRGLSLVGLADGDALAIGGTPSPYSACMGCLRNVWRFHAAERMWREAAPLSVPRSEFSATLLPDGGVLVAGGWSERSQDAEASVEVFDPRTRSWQSFPPMPAPASGHMAHWMAGARGKVLLVGGGTNPQIQALDVAQREWRTVGEMARYRIGANLVSYLDEQQQPWVAAFGGIHFPRGQNPRLDATVERVVLRLHEVPLTAGRELPLGRAWPALATDGAGRVLVAGGAIDADPGNVATGSVDMVSVDGARLVALPALGHARYGGVAGWLASDSAVVAGGRPLGYGSGQRAAPALPVEVYDARGGRWTSLSSEAGEPITIPADAAVGIVPRSGVLVATGAVVSRYAIRGTRATAQALPPLPHARRESVVRVLDDGRIVIAGGSIQAEVIAVAGESGDAEQDEYEGVGEFAPARTHSIFDPTRKGWRESAPSRTAGAAVAVLDDGRVVRAGMLGEPTDPDGEPRQQQLLVEICDRDGTAWSPLPAPEGLDAHDHNLELFTQQGEIFLKSERGDNAILQWFDASTGRWAELHQWPRWNANMGRLMSLTTGNGKRVVWVWPSRPH
jgi:hypothetical protein